MITETVYHVDEFCKSCVQVLSNQIRNVPFYFFPKQGISTVGHKVTLSFWYDNDNKAALTNTNTPV